MLLGNGQRGRVDPLVDHLPLPRLEREQTLSCVTHPAPGTHTQRHTLIALTLGSLLYKYACLNVQLGERHAAIIARRSQTHRCGKEIQNANKDAHSHLSHHRLEDSVVNVDIPGSFGKPKLLCEKFL